MSYKINYTGGTNTDHISDLEEEYKDYITTLKADPRNLIFEFSSISEIKGYCFGNKKGCEEINWKKLLEERNIIVKNTFFDIVDVDGKNENKTKELKSQDGTIIYTITFSDFNKYISANTCLKLSKQTEKNNQDYCIAFFKYAEKCKRTDSDIRDAVKMWLKDKKKASDDYGNIKDWDVSEVADMSNLFRNASGFNENIGQWDVSQVTNMRDMFRYTYAFNQDIGQWNVSQVTNMRGMFWNAAAFNQDIGQWNVSRATTMYGMFQDAAAFNQAIGQWNVSQVTNMHGMFNGAAAFNQDIGQWDVSHVIDMSGMFYGSAAFNQDIGQWNVSQVTNMESMFRGSAAFNQDIGQWNVSQVTDMSYMFKGTAAFNQDINTKEITAENSPTGEAYTAWDMSSNTNMKDMFAASRLKNNEPIWYVESNLIL